MTNEEKQLRAQRHQRIARTKRLLRWMPRRANAHRYPVVKWFAAAARKRSELWSFRIRPVVSALYVGSILSIMPLYGVQLLLAVLASFAFRANLPVMVGLQLITNPFTVIPVYFAAFQIGRIMLALVGLEINNLNRAQLEILFRSMRAGNWGSNFAYFFSVWGVTMLGGLIIGLFVGTVASWFYKVAATEFSKNYQRLREIQHQRVAAAPDSPMSEDETAPPLKGGEAAR